MNVDKITEIYSSLTGAGISSAEATAVVVQLISAGKV